jgi:hypothetical protein
MKANPEEVYRHIGYLFYAISSEREMISSREFNKLTELVGHNWPTLTKGDKKLDAKLIGYLHSGIRNAFDNSMKASEAYAFFEGYYSIHHLLFGAALRETILQFSNYLEEELFGTRQRLPVIIELQKLLPLQPHVN